MDDKIKELGEERVGRLLKRFYIPAFVGVIANALYNIIDRIFIGQGVGVYALSGLSVIFPIMIIMMSFGMLVGVGSGVFVSINLGKGDKEKTERVIGNGFLLMIIVSALIMILGFGFKESLLNLFGATDQTRTYADDYLTIILWGTVFEVVGFSMNNIIRAEGNAKTAMASMLISAGSNAVLAPIFIFSFGWGVKGAAWATVLSMFILMVWVVLHFVRKKAVLRLKLSNMKPDSSIIIGILGIGMAPFAMQMAASAIQGIFNVSLIRYGGDIAIGAMGVINSISTIIIMSIIALNMASQPIISFNYGAHKYDRVLQTLKLTMKAAVLISVLSWVIIEIMPGPLVQLFNHSDRSLYEIGTRGLRIFLACLPIIGVQIIASSFFQSIGKAKKALLISLMRQVIVIVPLLLLLPRFFKLTGVWLAGPASDLISAIIIYFFIAHEWRILKGQVREQKSTVSVGSSY